MTGNNLNADRYRNNYVKTIPCSTYHEEKKSESFAYDP